MTGNHPMCWGCWGKYRPGRTPHRLVETELETCAWCGHATVSGIYVRGDPDDDLWPESYEAGWP